MGSIISALIWPFTSVLLTLKTVRENGGVIAERQGISLPRQFAEQIFLANRCNISPHSYYKFKLFCKERRAQTKYFIQHHEICTLLPGLYRGLDMQRVDHKLRFYESAVEYDLPIPQVIVAFADGSIVRWLSRQERLPLCDLVMKPCNLYCGIGVRCWRYNACGDEWECDSRRLNAEGLILFCQESSRQGPFILQRRIFNHRELRPLAGDGVCTVRVVTYRKANEIGLLLACFRMPTKDSFVDNFAAGGIAAPVTVTTGVLGVAVSKDVGKGLTAFHPDSQAQIQGRRLPFWKETVALAIKAHACFSEFAFIGWDVAITDEGPMLLEANLPWCAEICQITHDYPLGLTRFTELFLTEAQLRFGSG